MCGIAAFYGDNALFRTLVMLLELQHRGQESVGISIFDNNTLKTEVRRGLVIENLDLIHKFNTDKITYAIGHVRYSTAGGYMETGAQPIEVGDKLRIALAFNGNIMNYKELADMLGVRNPKSDSEVLAVLIHHLAKEHGDIVEAIKVLPRYVIGSYSLVVLTNEPRVVIARDPRGFKPLAYTYDNELFVAASETSALENIGSKEWNEVAPGQVISFDGKAVEVSNMFEKVTPTPCAFEYVYFSRPDSVFNETQVHEARIRMGEILAELAPTKADVVIPVPDSGRSAAIGYSLKSGIPMNEGLMPNRYIGRSFIMPPFMRKFIASIKYGVIKSVVNGKKIVLIDDSIIRGTTMKSIVELLRNAGAREIHVRIASPPVRYPCFMGIDFPSRRELIASSMDINTISRFIGADSLIYNTVYGLKKSIGLSNLCLACYTGIYPFKHLDIEKLEKTFIRWAS